MIIYIYCKITRFIPTTTVQQEHLCNLNTNTTNNSDYLLKYIKPCLPLTQVVKRIPGEHVVAGVRYHFVDPWRRE